MPFLSMLALVAAAVPVAYWSLSQLTLRWAYAHYTVLNDIKGLGAARKDGRKLARTAVVCGGSISGLLAARVCATHVEEVVVIDPDNDGLLDRATAANGPLNPDGKEEKGHSRPRVMQWDAYHAAQPIFFAGLKRLFPELEAQMAAANASESSADYNVHLGGIRLPVPVASFPDEGRSRYGLSRAANETVIRRMLKSYQNIRFVSGTVQGFEVDPANPKSISAVRYRPRNEESTVVQEADLVLDCSGAAQAGLSWLRRADFLPSDGELVEKYTPNMRYVTCWFTVDPTVLDQLYPPNYDAKSAFLGFFIPIPGMERRFFMIEKQENNRLSMLCGGFGFDESIESVADIRRFAGSLKQLAPQPAWVSSLLDYLEGEPSTTARFVRSSVPTMSYVHYDTVRSSLPNNFVALGDAVMKLNQITGQGMGKAVVEATVLDTLLRAALAGKGKVPSGTSSAYFRRSTAVTRYQWIWSKYTDYGAPACEPSKGETLAAGANYRKYLGAFAKRMLKGDRDLLRRFMSVRFWMGPPTLFMGPSAFFKVSRDMIKG